MRLKDRAIALRHLGRREIIIKKTFPTQAPKMCGDQGEGLELLQRMKAAWKLLQGKLRLKEEYEPVGEGA